MNQIQLYTVNQACSVLGIGRTKLYEMIGEGRISSVQIGRSRRIALHELERFCGAPVAGA